LQISLIFSDHNNIVVKIYAKTDLIANI